MRRAGRRGFKTELLVVNITLMALLVVVVPAFLHWWSRGRQAQCQSHLLKIAAALEAWANDHNGRYPDRLERLLEPRTSASTAPADREPVSPASPGKQASPASRDGGVPGGEPYLASLPACPVGQRTPWSYSVCPGPGGTAAESAYTICCQGGGHRTWRGSAAAPPSASGHHPLAPSLSPSPHVGR